MIGPALMMIIAALASLLMLGVLGTQAHSGIAGVKSCIHATLVTCISVLIMAARPLLPPWIGVVVGDTLLAVAMALYVAATRQFFHRGVPVRALVLLVVLEALGLAVFWYVWRDSAMRTVVISLVHCILTTMMAATILRNWPLHRPAYPYMFALGMSLLQAIGHALRAAVYLIRVDAVDAMHQASPFQTVFFSLGLLTVPGFTLGIIVMVHDRMLAERETEASTDALTGVLSRKTWWLLARKTVFRAVRNHQRFCLLVLDIDGFKRINETYGSQLGDAVLRHFVALAADVLREDDIVGRIGGEKFAVIFPDTGIDAALFAGEKLLQAVREDACVCGNWSIAYAFSAGLAQWDGQESAHALAERAGRALAAAKAGGRGRVVAQR